MRGQSSATVTRRGALLAAAVLSIFLLCLCGRASAAQLHEYTGTAFGPDGVGGIQSFQNVHGLAVDQETGDIFVLDASAGKIYKFDSSGAPSDFSGLGRSYIEGITPTGGADAEEQIAVAPSGSPGGTAGDIYLANNEQSLRIFNAAGEELAELHLGRAVRGVGVNESGRLFVATAPSTVKEYLPSANPPVAGDQTAESSEVLFEKLGNIALDGTGNIYGAHWAGRIETELPDGERVYVGGVEKLEGINATKSKVIDPEGVSLAVEAGTNDLYADRKNQIVQYNAAGKRLGSFGQGVIEKSLAVGVNAAGSSVFVATPSKVLVFGPKLELPEAEVETTTEITDTSAHLNGWIEAASPLEATCQFEYVAEASYRENEATEPFADASSEVCDPAGPFVGSVRETVSADLAGLSPRTTYFFRLQGTNVNGSNFSEVLSFSTRAIPYPPAHSFGPCPNEALREGLGLHLPDCRAYELVSPTEKWGSMAEPYEANLQASADGSTVTWFTGESGSGIPSPGTAAHQDPAFYSSSRSAGAWLSQRLLPPEEDGERGHYSGLTADGHYAVLEASGRGGENPALYLLNTESHEVTQMVAPQAGGTVENRAFAFDGASADDSLFYFESALQLNSAAAPGKNNLYVWDRVTGTLSVAGLLPGAKVEAPAGGSFGGAYAWWEDAPGGVSLESGGAKNGQYVGALHAISESGDRVYFTAGASGQLYLRSGLTGTKPATVRVSVANSGVTDPKGQKPAAFQEATPEGGFAFFTSSGKLTSNANTGSEDQGNDLYRYDAVAKTLVDVAPLAEGAGARVLGVLGVARNGRSGFLAAEGVLASGGIEGEDNLYHFEEGTTGVFAFTFVAALPHGETEERNWSPSASVPKTGRVSEDGGTMLFMSSTQLTGEPSGRCAYGVCAQVFRYSVDTGTLDCLSCNPYAELGSAVYGAELSTAIAPNLVPENAPVQGVLPRNLSSEGTRVFFQTSEALLPEDVNGHGCTTPRHCVDVYEWEAVGTPGGSCHVVEIAGGCLYLVSTGESDESSYFVDATPDGKSVFFISKSQFVPVDEDQLDDIYDARIEGGLAAQQETSHAACSSSEACRGAAVAAAPELGAATPGFEGPGNVKVVKPKSCKKGFVRKSGKCVKKVKPKHKHKKHKKGRSVGKGHKGGKK